MSPAAQDGAGPAEPSGGGKSVLHDISFVVRKVGTPALLSRTAEAASRPPAVQLAWWGGAGAGLRGHPGQAAPVPQVESHALAKQRRALRAERRRWLR